MMRGFTQSVYWCSNKYCYYYFLISIIFIVFFSIFPIIIFTGPYVSLSLNLCIDAAMNFLSSLVDIILIVVLSWSFSFLFNLQVCSALKSRFFKCWSSELSYSFPICWSNEMPAVLVSGCNSIDEWPRKNSRIRFLILSLINVSQFYFFKPCLLSFVAAANLLSSFSPPFNNLSIYLMLH